MKPLPGPYSLFSSNCHDCIEVQVRVKGELVTLAKVICPPVDADGPLPCEDPQAVATGTLFALSPDLLEHARWVAQLFGTTSPKGDEELKGHIAALRELVAKMDG